MANTLYLGVDLGGTQLKFGLVDEEYRIVHRDKVNTPTGIHELLGLIRDIWQDTEKSKRGRIASVGFGFPGILSLKERRILQSPNYPELDDFDLHGSLSRIVDVPFWVDNDANMAAFGEWTCGAGKGVQSMILLTVGTGLGSGIILGRRLWHGKCGFGGELGHITVNPDGDTCNCGNQGCLETEVSAPKIVKKYLSLRNNDETITAEEVYRRAKNGDEKARESFAQAGYYLGIGIGIAINFLNPEKILLGGGVMTTGDFLLPPAIEEAKRRSYRQSFACCSIERASLGNDAGLIGAAAWARERLKYKKHSG